MHPLPHLPATASHRLPPSRRKAVVLALIQEKDTLASLAHTYGISAHDLLSWRTAYFKKALH